MKKENLVFFTAKVKNYDLKDYYLFSDEEGIFRVPINVMHRDCDLHNWFDDMGFVAPMTILHMAKKITKDKVFYYPDKNFYCSGSSAKTSSKSFLGKCESDFMEWKASFSERDTIIISLTAFANAKHKGQVVVGKDNAGKIVGLPQICEGCDLSNKNGQQDYVRKFKKKILSKTNNESFVKFVQIDFQNVGKLVCIVSLDKWNEAPIHIREKNDNYSYYLRKDSENHKMKGKELEDFLKSFNR